MLRGSPLSKGMVTSAMKNLFYGAEFERKSKLKGIIENAGSIAMDTAHAHNPIEW